MLGRRDNQHDGIVYGDAGLGTLVFMRPHRERASPTTKTFAIRSPLVRLNAVCP